MRSRRETQQKKKLFYFSPIKGGGVVGGEILQRHLKKKQKGKRDITGKGILVGMMGVCGGGELL